MVTINPPRPWLEVLPEDECWRILRLCTVGRLAVVVDGDPMIWPLNIAVDDDGVVVFRSGAGSKLTALGAEPKVALEVDGLDFALAKGWSVVVSGRARQLTGDELTRAQQLPLRPWTVGDKPTWFGIVADSISGRSIGDPELASTGAGRPR
jgi:nitroimidazol reductase NimA-like FMN-containing flavoprotein (pyridoxamine 5'-phosphate oxidase superfamily)